MVGVYRQAVWLGSITINQQNYLDGVLLSFDDIRPDIALNVMASSIYVGCIVYTPTREPDGHTE